MAKRLFHSCRSPSAAAAITPTTTLLAASDHQPHVVPAHAGAACCPRGVPRRRSLPPAPCGSTADCHGADDDLIPPARGTPAYRWLKSSRWHVIEANAYATADGNDDDEAPRLKIDARRRVRRRSLRRRRRALHHRRAAAASCSSDDDSGWFSTDGEQPYARGGAESSTLVSSSSSTGGTSAPGTAGAAREEEEEEREPVAAVAGGFAVVKRSEDPRADFRRSMAEMVVGRGIYDADGLERLLRCFLALNDQRHRRDIVAAFRDVWEAVFANPSPCDAKQPTNGDDVASSHAASSAGKAKAAAAVVCPPP
ncbi:hypothetical protein PR202_ga26730 [Eleusine coracana subsp. coracana]|uniref:Transcription repressor n=1 Tax=Eleusine coracana subsp. coracana TaxID=191504 RepID=A0AAV5DEW8_ELECO|nr:hypothetical protein QOZ80_3AG0237430 [Eleusine coracana subsp. coracana]GJN08775.1 hypothetical protein PR202_ga26730 [Eleusine coracana subsp. coracana]